MRTCVQDVAFLLEGDEQREMRGGDYQRERGNRNENTRNFCRVTDFVLFLFHLNDYSYF